MENLLEKIAKDYLGIKTLNSRKSDGLDFYDCAVWDIRKALKQAFKAGQESKNVND